MIRQRSGLIQTTITLPEQLIRRSQALRDQLHLVGDGISATRTKTSAIRLAVARGLPLLEEEIRQARDREELELLEQSTEAA